MDKSDVRAHTNQNNVTLEKVLVQTADNTTQCLKLLKKDLSKYDSRHGNHFIHTAVSYMRSDMRTAKDTAVDLKRVAHDMNKSSQVSESEIHAARNTMKATAKAMDLLQTTARNYDQQKGRSKGVKGTIDNVVGHNDKEKHEKKGGLFSKNDDKENQESKLGKLFGKSDKDKHDKNIGGKIKKEKDSTHGGKLESTSNDHHVLDTSGLSGSDTVEMLVKTTLRDHFSLDALSCQITITEKSLKTLPTSPTSSPSFVERAKEAVKEVKEKIMGDTSNEGQDAHKHGATP